MRWAYQMGGDPRDGSLTGKNIHETPNGFLRNSPCQSVTVADFQALEKGGRQSEELHLGDLPRHFYRAMQKQGVDYFYGAAGVLLRYVPTHSSPD